MLHNVIVNCWYITGLKASAVVMATWRHTSVCSNDFRIVFVDLSAVWAWLVMSRGITPAPPSLNTHTHTQNVNITVANTLPKKLKPDKFFLGNKFQNYGVSPKYGVCHTILLSARHKRAHPALTPASKAGTRFIYPGGMEGWVDLGALIVWLCPGR